MSRSCVTPELLKFAQHIAITIFARGAAIPEVRESPTDGVIFTWNDFNMICHINIPDVGVLIYIDTYATLINYEELSESCANTVAQTILDHLSFQ